MAAGQFDGGGFCGSCVQTVGKDVFFMDVECGCNSGGYLVESELDFYWGGAVFGDDIGGVGGVLYGIFWRGAVVDKAVDQPGVGGAGAGDFVDPVVVDPGEGVFGGDISVIAAPLIILQICQFLRR